MNLHSDVLRLIPWLANYKNSQQGNKPQGFSEWMKQKLEEFREFVVGMFAWLAAALEDLKEMLEEVLNKILMNLLAFLAYLLWLIIRAALLVLAYILLALVIAIFTVVLLAIYGLLIVVSLWFNAIASYELSHVIINFNESTYKLGYNILWEHNEFFKLDFPCLELSGDIDGQKFLKFSLNIIDLTINLQSDLGGLSQSSVEDDRPVSSSEDGIDDTRSWLIFFRLAVLLCGLLPAALFSAGGHLYKNGDDGKGTVSSVAGYLLGLVSVIVLMRTLWDYKDKEEGTFAGGVKFDVSSANYGFSFGIFSVGILFGIAMISALGGKYSTGAFWAIAAFAFQTFTLMYFDMPLNLYTDSMVLLFPLFAAFILMFGGMGVAKVKVINILIGYMFLLILLNMMVPGGTFYDLTMYLGQFIPRNDGTGPVSG